jgi:hypothetical protein
MRIAACNTLIRCVCNTRSQNNLDVGTSRSLSHIVIVVERAEPMSSKQSDLSQPILSAGLKPLFTMRGHKLAVSSVKYDLLLPYAPYCTFVLADVTMGVPICLHLSFNASVTGFRHVPDICFRLPLIKRCCYGTLRMANAFVNLSDTLVG